MELVVNIQNYNDLNVVSSRVVAEQLGKDVNDVKKKIREVLEIGTEYFPVQIKVRGKDAEDYLLTKDGFILLCMNYTGYNEFKRAYIAEFNRMEKALTELNRKSVLLANLFSDDKMTVVAAHKELVRMETAEAIKPIQEKLETTKVELEEANSEIQNVILKGKDTTFTINVASKILGFKKLGQNNLFELLRDKKHLNLNNCPSQRVLDNGLMIVTTRDTEDGYRYQPKLTMKGIFWLSRNISKLGYERIRTEKDLIEEIKAHIEIGK